MVAKTLTATVIAATALLCAPTAAAEGASQMSAQDVQRLMADFYRCPSLDRADGLTTALVLSGTGGDSAIVSIADYRARRWRMYSDFKPKNSAKPRQVKGTAYIDGAFFNCQAGTVADCEWKEGFPAKKIGEKADAELNVYLQFREYLLPDAAGASLKLLPLDTDIPGSVWKLEITPPRGQAANFYIDASGKIVGQFSSDPYSPIEGRATEFQEVEGCVFPAKVESRWRGRPERRGEVRSMTFDIRRSLSQEDTSITVNGKVR